MHPSALCGCPRCNGPVWTDSLDQYERRCLACGWREYLPTPEAQLPTQEDIERYRQQGRGEGEATQHRQAQAVYREKVAQVAQLIELRKKQGKETTLGVVAWHLGKVPRRAKKYLRDAQAYRDSKENADVAME